MRTPTHFIVTAGIVLVLGCASGCVISDFPLSDPATSDGDKLLYGRWRADDGDAHSTMEFASPTESTPKVHGLGNERVMVLTHARYEKDERQPSFATTSRVFVTQIEDTWFLNVYDEQERGYSILRYRIDGETLDTWRMDTDATADALRRGDLLTGEVTYEKGSANRVRIKKATLKEDGTSLSRLRALLTGKDAEQIFPVDCKTRYKRIKDEK